MPEWDPSGSYDDEGEGQWEGDGEAYADMEPDLLPSEEELAEEEILRQGESSSSWIVLDWNADVSTFLSCRHLVSCAHHIGGGREGVLSVEVGADCRGKCAPVPPCMQCGKSADVAAMECQTAARHAPTTCQNRQ